MKVRGVSIGKMLTLKSDRERHEDLAAKPTGHRSSGQERFWGGLGVPTLEPFLSGQPIKRSKP